MLGRVGLVAALLLAVSGLHLEFQQPPVGGRFGQAGQELSGAAGVAGEAGWPWHLGGHHTETESTEQQPLTDDAPTAPVAAPEGRLAVLVTGAVERLLLTPLLANVVRANAKKGLQVDLLLSLQAPSSIVEEDAPDLQRGCRCSRDARRHCDQRPQGHAASSGRQRGQLQHHRHGPNLLAGPGAARVELPVGHRGANRRRHRERHSNRPRRRGRRRRHRPG
ncbi:unnamed protein product, partial [Prorocentrum cordatum]